MGEAKGNDGGKRIVRLPDDPQLSPEAARQRQLEGGFAAKRAKQMWKRKKKRRGRERRG